MAAENKIPTVLFELIDQRDSGFIQDGTRGTANENQLRAPQVSWIPNTGLTCDLIKDEKSGIVTPTYREIRYIKNSNIIDKAEQDKMHIKPNPHVDLIEFKQATKLVSRQGSSINEYDYLMTVFYNAGAANRPDSATAIYRAVDLNKNAEILAEDDEDLERALNIVNSLKVKTGSKDQPYQYNEERIEGICTILGVAADTPAQKVYTISAFAKAQPRAFLQKVENFEQFIQTEVNHAVQLNVITFENNAAIFPEDQEVIKDLGKGNLGMDKKINRLSDFLKTNEGNAALTKMRLLTQLAKENQIQ